MRVRFSVAARRDVVEAKTWYQAQDPDAALDLAFAHELEQVVEQIRRFPTAFPKTFLDARRANLSRFPYGVFYVRRRSDLLVLAVLHHARHPSRWQQRYDTNR
ncbi:MAG: type II toxin-antitoxin system RelE/ParE family toxin [Thermoanaerobaculia bacterium]|nr:type II toxin-antitoxin system RelE/ParE family toxin [Thermoanaerobaculia bacterium]